LEGFWLGQTPITQAQWRVVASWPKVERELAKDPSYFKGDDRPVKLVSWHDAMEFCRRLSQRLGPTFSLPSEAQWEYACRAGTTTPFAFGDTISPELANYDGTVAYANGPKGVRRGETTPAGTFPANAWGLQDMHGNVWEWCLDQWHDSYKGAPSDGSAWLSNAGEDAGRLLRGGSWYSLPGRCRSACRLHLRPGDVSDRVGFRVVCLPQGPSLNS
jgi:formylglycine-generating enzyme required for sulfatase activity